jgi:Asp-tRNA(Asn)/Glu-tRNA(Gln) amidotransferase A subunit family amidase
VQAWLARHPRWTFRRRIRASKFTPRDVIDEVIAAPEETDTLCNIMATDMFGPRASKVDRATAAEGGRSEGAQIVAPWLPEDTLLSVAAAFDRARSWADAWPRFTSN